VSDFEGMPPEYRPLVDEAIRLAATVQDWVKRAMSEGGHRVDGEHASHGTDCAWCPLCQFVAVVRGDRPEVTERVAEAGTVFLSAMRAVIEAAGTATGQAASAAGQAAGQAASAAGQAASAAGQARAAASTVPPPPAAPRVQKINLGDAS